MNESMGSEFVRNLEVILTMEAGSLGSESVLADLKAWDSLAALSTITLIDANYGVTLEGTEILNCRTIGDLMELVEARGGK